MRNNGKMGTNQHYITRLEKKGVKPTAVRILVFRALEEAQLPVSLLDLENLLETVDKSTIFRTLNAFLAHHLIHAIEDGSGSLKYCLCHNHGHCTNEEEHCHFYCECCGKTYCLDQDLIPHVDIPEGFIARKVNYIVKGTCAECAKHVSPTRCPNKGKPSR